MPIFEYRCNACGREFETLVRPGTTPRCVACQAEDLEKLLSLPAVHSESTHGLAMKAANRRDQRLASDNARAQREYELKHDD